RLTLKKIWTNAESVLAFARYAYRVHPILFLLLRFSEAAGGGRDALYLTTRTDSPKSRQPPGGFFHGRGRAGITQEPSRVTQYRQHSHQRNHRTVAARACHARVSEYRRGLGSRLWRPPGAAPDPARHG